MEFRRTRIPGCYEIRAHPHEDARGRFVKTLHRGSFERHGLASDFAEEYYSVSGAGVVRGLHFQRPPADHVKLVYCIDGEVFDVVLDLRKGSPTFGSFQEFRLSASAANALYIPRGLAHGFCVPAGRATLVYKTSTVHSPEHDAGIRWDSVGVPWPCEQPVLSDRDQAFPPLHEFETPFVYESA